jgi:hypothetical protein
MFNGVNRSIMSSNRIINVAVVDTGQLGNVVTSLAHSGQMLDRGLSDVVKERYPGVEVRVSAMASNGFAALRQELASPGSSLIESSPDVVMLSVGDEVGRFHSGGETAPESVRMIEDDLRAIVGAVKSKNGAHIIISGLSTLDPGDPMYTLHGRAEEPFSLRAQRLNLMLVGMSHQEGISIVDVDRIIAEVGGAQSVVGPGQFNEVGAAAVLDEIVRILDDYGFMDDRPLMEQVGARGGKT